MLPVAPSQIETKIKNQNKTINLISGDEVNILNQAGLSEISFSALLPEAQYPFADYIGGFKGAKYFLEKLEALKVSKEPFAFIASKTASDGTVTFYRSIKVSLEDYSFDEDAKEGADINVTVNLKQYVGFGTKKVDVYATSAALSAALNSSSSSSSGTPAVALITTQREQSAAPKAATYTVQSGDTLWNIAKAYLGDGAKYRDLAELNDISNPNKISVGQVIRLDL